MKWNWKHRFTGALTVLAGGLALTAMDASAQRLRLATLAPKGTSLHQNLLQMGSDWQKASGGKVQLTIYTDGTMGGEGDMVRRMRIGQIQAATLTMQGLAQIDESVRAIQMMPMMFRDLREFDHVFAKVRGTVEAKLREKGFEVLSWGDLGYLHFFSREAARLPDDYRKMKLFVYTGDTSTKKLIDIMGFRGVPLDQTDTLTSLQTGLVDMVSAPPVYALSGQVYRPAPHMLQLNWVPLVGGTVISTRDWGRIPAALQTALRKAAASAGERIKQAGRQESIESVAAMEKRGLKIIVPTAGEIHEWEKFGETLYPNIRGQLVPAELFDQVRALVLEFRASGGK